MKRLALTAFVIIGLVFIFQAQTKHTISEKFGGDIVFDVSADGLHGLIAETKDQGSCDFKDAAALVAKPENHSEEGKAFTDWRVPTISELKILILQKTIVGGFASAKYWSSTKDVSKFFEWSMGKVGQTKNTQSFLVRSIRSFKSNTHLAQVYLTCAFVYNHSCHFKYS